MSGFARQLTEMTVEEHWSCPMVCKARTHSGQLFVNSAVLCMTQGLTFDSVVL